MSFLPHQCHSFRITVISSRCLSFFPDFCHYFQIFVILPSLAWLGVYILGYYNFSIGWMVTPLLLRCAPSSSISNRSSKTSRCQCESYSVLRDQWKKEKRKRLTAAREAALTNEQVGFPLFIFVPLNCQDFLFLSFHISSFMLLSSRLCWRHGWVSRNSRLGFSFRIRNEQSGSTLCSNRYCLRKIYSGDQN